ncbi:MAG: Rieske (2Fe-2S) protein [Actinomycetota bacterium]|jgi:nitrite reductase (NADH) small subunit|nr:Rieske (2Fe-2S) protein [Actinomycetota bacterium]
MSEWHDVGSLGELEQKGRVVASIGGREVGVLVDPVAERVVAVRNRCPHQGGPLCRGMICERIGGAPGTYELQRQTVLRCPWHGWEFDVESGICREDARMRVAVYPVKIDNGRVLVKA